MAVKVPSSSKEWKRISDDFWKLWGFPLCLGVIDGKHCVIQCPPPNSGSAFYNYKGTFSIVMMAAADASYMFTFIGIGDFGHQTDSSIFNTSPFGEAPNKGLLNMPNEGQLPNTDQTAKLCFIGDEAFPLKENILRPYPGKNLNEKLIWYIQQAFIQCFPKWGIVKNAGLILTSEITNVNDSEVLHLCRGASTPY